MNPPKISALGQEDITLEMEDILYRRYFLLNKKLELFQVYTIITLVAKTVLSFLIIISYVLLYCNFNDLLL